MAWSLLLQSCRQGRLLIVWGQSPFSPAERPPANRAAAISRWAALPLPPLAVPLPDLPPLPILSLDPSGRIEQAFQAAGVSLQVVCSHQNALRRTGHCLLKLAGDLATRSGLILSHAEIQDLHGDPDKRHILDEARRTAAGGAVLLLGCEPAGQDWRAWRPMLEPALRRATWFAFGGSLAGWPAGITTLDEDWATICAALNEACPPAPAPDAGAVDRAALRELLVNALDDGALTALCFDVFHPVHERFAEGMDKPQKVQLLLAHVERHGQAAQLVAEVRARNPYQYARYAARLGGAG